VYDCDVREQ
jgi:hypothetical protein